MLRPPDCDATDLFQAPSAVIRGDEPQIGQGAAEKNTQHLIVTYAGAAAEMAMYESLATSASAGGAQDVVSLAQTLFREEREDAEQVWDILPRSAAASFQAELQKANSRRR
jgi:rubrerythrin